MQLKNYLILFLVCGMFICITNKGYGQKNARKLNEEFKQSVLLSGGFVNASLETNVSFEIENSLLIARIGLGLGVTLKF